MILKSPLLHAWNFIVNIYSNSLTKNVQNYARYKKYLTQYLKFSFEPDCSLASMLRGSASASTGYFEISCFESHSQHVGDGVSVYTHTQVATVLITFALSVSEISPFLKLESVTFPNFVGTTNSVGSSFGLSLSEIGLAETFDRTGVLFCVGEKESLRLSSDFSSNEDLDESVTVETIVDDDFSDSLSLGVS